MLYNQTIGLYIWKNYCYHFDILEPVKDTLFIDTTLANQIRVELEANGKKYKKEASQKFGSQVLLRLIEEVLQEAGIKTPDLEEIKVNTGPGSFTGIKVGVSVANALGYSLGIPVNGKEMELDIKYE